MQEIVLASKIILHSEDGDESANSSLTWKDFMQVCQALADLPENWPISESVAQTAHGFQIYLVLNLHILSTVYQLQPAQISSDVYLGVSTTCRFSFK
jgi:hypothetical protein